MLRKRLIQLLQEKEGAIRRNEDDMKSNSRLCMIVCIL